MSGFSVLNLTWEGIPAQRLLELAPPRDDVRYVVAWAQYGYSANMTLADFTAPTTILATGVNGQPLAITAQLQEGTALSVDDSDVSGTGLCRRHDEGSDTAFDKALDSNDGIDWITCQF